MQEVKNNPTATPVATSGLKKPSGSLNDLTRQQVHVLLDRAEQESNEKLRHQLYLRISQLLKPTGSDGFGRFSAIGLAYRCSAVLCSALLIGSIYFALRPSDSYRVLLKRSDTNLTIQQVHRGHALTPAVMFFCEPQPFEAGHTLTAFSFGYDPSKLCYSVKAYSLLRDAATCPIVPVNCRHTDCADPISDRVVCNGSPKFD